jgi:hypothetical protein
VAGDQDAIQTELMPGTGEIWQRNTPVRVFLVDVGLVDKAEGTIRCFGEISFVVLTFVLKGDFGIQAKEWGKEMGGVGW